MYIRFAVRENEARLRMSESGARPEAMVNAIQVSLRVTAD